MIFSLSFLYLCAIASLYSLYVYHSIPHASVDVMERWTYELAHDCELTNLCNTDIYIISITASLKMLWFLHDIVTISYFYHINFITSCLPVTNFNICIYAIILCHRTEL